LYRLKPRWDVALLVGRGLEKLELARNPGLSYGEVASRSPRWMPEVLEQYKSAVERAEGKTCKTYAFYRLHATRLRAVTADLREGAGPLEPDVGLLKLLASHACDEANAETARNPDRAKLRWRVLLDGLEAMARCRSKLDPHDHRSAYRRARTLEVAQRLAPPGLSQQEEQQREGEEEGEPQAFGVEAASDAMYVLFEKKKAQGLAVWMPDESTSAFEVINQVRGVRRDGARCRHGMPHEFAWPNAMLMPPVSPPPRQRTRKYERIRRQYIDYYFSLLRRCRDHARLLDFYRKYVKSHFAKGRPWTGLMCAVALRVLLQCSGLP
jgi:hypothetical protein